ncbi:prolyl oligopeptidase family serine peptidase [Opitutus sp. ER46]|uniref:S9 family peptidase n=1 Tax=Opitutus sp. ER46 TaxID=2161864 RepID=UPI001305028E|nr:prolyl oligopeptidase family serine peptidase [Opitutus sp. ER46]
MSSCVRSILACVAPALLLVLSPTAARASDVTRGQLTALLSPDRIIAATLAPDGRHVAFVAQEPDRTSLLIRDLDAAAAETVTVWSGAGTARTFSFRATASFSDRVNFLGWADAQTFVYGLHEGADGHGPELELHVVDASGRNRRRLIDSDSLAVVHGSGSEAKARPFIVLGFAAGAAPEVLVQVGSGIAGVEVLAIDPQTGRRRTIADERRRGRYLCDATGEPRIFCPFEEDAGKDPQFEYRPAHSKRWQALEQRVPELRFRASDSAYFEPHAFPLGFGGESEGLYFATNVGRDTYAVRLLRLEREAHTACVAEDAAYDLAKPDDAFGEGPLVFDRARRLAGVRRPAAGAGTRWLNPELQRLQDELDARFVGASVTIIEWTEAYDRVLVHVAEDGTAGRLHLARRGATLEVAEILRPLDPTSAEARPTVLPLVVTAPAGHTLSGCITLAHEPRRDPAPLVVVLHDLLRPALQTADPSVPWRPISRRHRLAQSLAAFGFHVLEVECRGTSGRGAAFRNTLKDAPVRAPLDDVQAMLAAAARVQACDVRRVSIVGEGYGGLLALRALGLFPNQFRAAVSIQAPMDLAAWIQAPVTAPLLPIDEKPLPFEGGEGRPMLIAPAVRGPHWRRSAWQMRFGAFFGGNAAWLREASVTTDVGALGAPVLVLEDPAPLLQPGPGGRELYHRVKRAGKAAEYRALHGPLLAGAVEEQLAAVTHLAGFLNTHLYDYAVQVGAEKEVP